MDKMKNKIVRSPFFYVGDKYKLMTQLQKIMPENIKNYIEPFVGGGSSYLNSRGDNYILNDANEYIIMLHEELSSYKDKPDVLINKLYKLIDKYGLSCSYRGITVPTELKKEYVKTYYAHYNKEAYIKMRNEFNKTKKNMLLLYLLLIYGFNHMIRFNSSGNFNLSVGNVDFNKNVYKALIEYLNFAKSNNIYYNKYDYKDFLNSIDFTKDDYIFLDPPYLISMSEYNKLWNEDKEKELCNCLDELNKKGIKWGVTNLIYHKDKENVTFHEWSEKYTVYDINSNYISFNDNTIKKNSKEVFVTNYVK
jgi:DNA adenine methylase Dam